MAMPGADCRLCLRSSNNDWNPSRQLWLLCWHAAQTMVHLDNIYMLQVICSGGSWQFIYIYAVCSTHTLQASQELGTCCEAPLQR